MLKLEIIKRTYPQILKNMEVHYSKPKGFVGRNICYKIEYNERYYGSIVGGSATLHLPNRNSYFNLYIQNKWYLENIVNNIFFHIEPLDGKYPIRNFSQLILNEFRSRIVEDWFGRYKDEVLGFETLVELPRSGEIYKRDGWDLIGQTKGYTCKREGGYGTDGWTGQRVWNTVDLRPKHVFVRICG